MSLTVKEIVVKNIPSRNKLFLWIYFRGSNYRATEIVQPSKGSARFQPQNWTFSTVAENELLIFELYQEKWGKDKFIGKVHVILGKLQQSNNLQFHGNKFVVDKKKEIKFELDFELEYQLPYDAPSCLNEHASSQTVFLMENFDENNDESDLNVSLPFPEFEIAEDWKVRLRVHKGKELHGKDCRPFVTVQILDQKYNTNTCDSANPIWEEEFMFNFKTNKPKFLDSIVYIKVFSAKNLLPKKETIGNAKFDLWTIYKKAKHCIQQKWVVLQEVNTEEIKGYVLLSISIYQTKEPVQITLIEDTNLDSNLFLPIGFLAPREIYAYSITVYKAESVAAAKRDDLIDIFNTIIPGKGRINISDPYVKVEFGGESISTKVVKKSVDAVFNQVIEFRDFFPPMYKRIKVALIDKEGGVDSDEILATHFIDLSDISYYGEEIDWINADYGIDVEYPPTFGPCWINLYGSTTDFDKHKYMNQGFAQGNSFRGRLLIEINCNPLENVNISDIKVCKSLDNIKVGNMKRENFLLYATIYDASMIEEKHKGKEIFFEITIGSCGIHDLNQSSANTEISSSNRQVNNDQSMKSMLLGMESLEDKWPFTQPVKASLASSKKSCYLDLEKLKPCVFLEFNKEDDSFRLHLIIMLNKMYNMIDECLCVVQKSTENISLAAINKAAINFSGQVEYVLNYYKSLLNQNMVNKLDTLLAEKRKQTLEQLLKLFSELRVPEVVIAQKIDILTIIKRHVGKLIKDPQQSFPDVFIWMIADKKRIAYARVKAESILYSEDKFICAPYAGKLHSLFLQFYKYEKQQRSQRYIQAKIEIRLWLGCSTKKPVNYLVNAPKGYQLPEVLSTPYLRNLEYKSTEKFILHAHIYQGRTVFGSDEDGLSDPFARIMFANSMEETWVVPNTRVPLWDQSFVFDNVSLYGDESKIYSPVVLITLFDKDPNDKEEFLGQAIAVPKIVNSNYVPAKLELKPIFIGKRSVGDIIAAFELFPVGYKNLPELPEETYRLQAFSKEPVRCIPVPKNIRPALVSYRIELLFWGLRDLEKHSGLFGKSVQRPQVIADFSYNATLLNGESTRKLKSSICRNAVRNPNFENPVFIFDMDLPHNIDFMPECTISVIDHQRFSSNKTTQLFATHTTAPVDKFICNPDDFKKIYFEGYGMFYC